VRVGGAGLLITGVLSLAICVTALRRGERWAWYAMWVWPLGIVAIILVLASAMREPGTEIPVPIISGAITIVISVVTLALSARRYLRNA
jgi:FtsH-binding integral membrane protein